MPPIWYDGGSFSLHVYARETHYRPHLAEAAAAFQAALSHEPIVRLEENLTQEKGGR